MVQPDLTNRMYDATLLFSTRDCQLFKLMHSSFHCLIVPICFHLSVVCLIR